MIGRTFVPPDLVAGAVSALVVTVAALAIALARMGARIARLEEWVRLYERKNGQ